MPTYEQAICDHEWVSRRQIGNPLEVIVYCRKCGLVKYPRPYDVWQPDWPYSGPLDRVAADERTR